MEPSAKENIKTIRDLTDAKLAICSWIQVVSATPFNLKKQLLRLYIHNSSSYCFTAIASIFTCKLRNN